MKVTLFNTLTKTKEAVASESVKIYSCGPTVYNYAHIGNFRSYIFADTLNRTLRLAGYTVQHAMNLTDVDDKTINGAIELTKKEPGKYADLKAALAAFTEPFAQAFFADLKKLNIIKFDLHPRATEHIPAMLDLVERLVKKGIAYEQDGSVYYKISEKKDYGRLSKVDLSKNKTGTRYNTDEYDKEDIRDFVLWKAENKEGVHWHSLHGDGRPGWHLECSAMIQEIFKGGIDIHTGGVDLIFPHHENEIAQSEAAYGGEFVKIWAHCEHLLVDNRKMSKSAGNFYTLRDLLDKGRRAEVIRYFLLSAHYSQKINFTEDALHQAEMGVDKVYHLWRRIGKLSVGVKDDLYNKEFVNHCSEFRVQFLENLADDLNTPRGIAVVHEFIGMVNSFLDVPNYKGLWIQEYDAIKETIKFFDEILGLLNFIPTETNTPTEIIRLLAERNKARDEKNYKLSDELRDQILEAGYKILDTKTGSHLEKI